MAKKNTKQANLTRAQTAKVLHEENTKKRAAEQKSLKALYLSDVENPLLVDILSKARSFINYHIKIAQDGVGSRKTGDTYENGQPVFETYFLTDSEVAGNMKKAAGIQELIDYIERQVKEPLPTQKPQAKQLTLVSAWCYSVNITVTQLRIFKHK